MPYYITTTNTICDAQAVNLAYEQELKKAGNWYDKREDAEKEVEARKERNNIKN